MWLFLQIGGSFYGWYIVIRHLNLKSTQKNGHGPKVQGMRVSIFGTGPGQASGGLKMTFQKSGEPPTTALVRNAMGLAATRWVCGFDQWLAEGSLKDWEVLNRVQKLKIMKLKRPLFYILVGVQVR